MDNSDLLREKNKQEVCSYLWCGSFITSIRRAAIPALHSGDTESCEFCHGFIFINKTERR